MAQFTRSRLSAAVDGLALGLATLAAGFLALWWYFPI